MSRPAQAIITEADAWQSLPGRFAGEWEGAASGSGISIIANRIESGGGGARLHRHAYPETFIIRSGRVVFVLDGEHVEGRAGQIVVVPAGVAHAFHNPGPEPLEMLDIHEHGSFQTEWLDG